MARCTFHSFWQPFPSIIPLLTSTFQVKERSKQVNRPLICTLLPGMIAVYKVIFGTPCGSASVHLLQRHSPQGSSAFIRPSHNPTNTFHNKTIPHFEQPCRRGEESQLLYGISLAAKVMFYSAGYPRKLSNYFGRFPCQQQNIR